MVPRSSEQSDGGEKNKEMQVMQPPQRCATDTHTPTKVLMGWIDFRSMPCGAPWYLRRRPLRLASSVGELPGQDWQLVCGPTVTEAIEEFWLKKPTHGGTVQADTLRISDVGFHWPFIFPRFLGCSCRLHLFLENLVSNNFPPQGVISVT